MAATEYVAPFIWAGATAVVLAVTWVLRSAMQKGIDDRVETKLVPLRERVRKVEHRVNKMQRDPDHLRAVPPIEDEQ